MQGVHRRTRALLHRPLASQLTTQYVLEGCHAKGLVAMAHGRRWCMLTDIRQLRAICHNHAAWLARPVHRPVRHFEVGTQAHAYLGRSIARRAMSQRI